MCIPCQSLVEHVGRAPSAACELSDINRKIALAQENLAGIVSGIRSNGISESQMEAAVKVLEDLQLEAMRAQMTVDGASEALLAGSQFGELDVLTALPNRLLLLDRLNHGIETASRRDKQLAVLFIDLDDFKQINDTHGHAVGDAVLVHVARCLQASVRKADTVSRIGGDEFVVLLTEVAGQEDVRVVVEKILTMLLGKCDFGVAALQLRASIGISLYPSGGASAAELIDKADKAMYRVKGRGGGGYSF